MVLDAAGLAKAWPSKAQASKVVAWGVLYAKRKEVFL